MDEAAYFDDDYYDIYGGDDCDGECEYCPTRYECDEASY